jgi:carboxymethylenebutenolidase
MGQWEQVSVEARQMRVYVNVTRSIRGAPAVVVIHHGWGVDEVIQEIADRLALEGYAAIAPDLFHRQAPEDDVMKRISGLRDSEVVADVRGAVAHLTARDPVGIGKFGIVGFCMGGRVAYLMAGSGLPLAAGAVFYGGDIALSWGSGPAPLALTPNIECPLIGFFGDEDTNPSPGDVRRLDEELTRHGKSHRFYTYADAGHAFMNFRLPNRYREAAARDAWQKLLAFFGTNLKG